MPHQTPDEFPQPAADEHLIGDVRIARDGRLTFTGTIVRASLFGIYMVARVTKNKALADSALARIRERGAAPLAMHSEATDSAFKKIHASVTKGPIT